MGKNHLLRAALIEEEELLSRLRAVRSLITSYGGDPNSDGGRADSAKHLRSAVEDILADADDLVPTKTLLKALSEQGFVVGGNVPSSTLSAYLSVDERFANEGRKGWRLAKPLTQERADD